ncbi:MAG TPA: hypothetical protein VFJ58_12850 [Armatimonadota bacterium]|nr:hypothetical protein [Armatimonadota bacterium]
MRSHTVCVVLAVAILSAVGLTGAVSGSYAAAPAPNSPRKLRIRYLIFTASPKKPAKQTGAAAPKTPPALDDLNSGIDFKLGKNPNALLKLLGKEVPGYRFHLILTGALTTESDKTAAIAGGPVKGDSYQAQVREWLTFDQNGPTDWAIRGKGTVKFNIPGTAGSERSGWGWDGLQPHVYIDHTQSIGDVGLLSGVIVVYARCLEYD